MGDLEVDTRVEPVDDRPGGYTAKLSADWNIWGPNGGYLASLALRAAGLAMGRARPASIVVHFLGVATFDRVDLDIDILRTSRFATSARVRVCQGDRPILEALVWGIDPGGVALDHDRAPAPAVPPVEEVPSFDDRMADVPVDQRRPPVAFFDNIDQHVVEWMAPFPPPGPVDPLVHSWVRFRPVGRFADPWVDACRLVIPIDTFGWPAANRAHAHVVPPRAMAVTIDLSVRLHRATEDEWLLSETVAPVGAGGLIAATGRLWDRTGALLASGGQTLLCRPAA